MKYCEALTRTGAKCQQPAGWGTDHFGEGRCKLHAGSSLRGADHPNFKTGIYSKYVRADIRDKIETYLEADPFDLTNELALTRALLADYLSRFQDGVPMGLDSIDAMTVLTDRIRKTVETIVKIRNESALTAAEVTFLATRIVGLLDKYIDDPDKREACKQELFSFVLPATTESFS